MTKVVTRFKQPRAKKPSRASQRKGMSPEHIDLVRQLPSCLSGAVPCDPHHLRIKGERGVGMKATDRWAVPLTRAEHTDVHKVGSKMEMAWFRGRGIDPLQLSAALWDATGDLDRMERIVLDHLEGDT
jgi:hypothetical protein